MKRTQRVIDRRQLLTATFGGLFGSVLLSRGGLAQQPPDPGPSTSLGGVARVASDGVGSGQIVPLSERLSLVTSGGTNVLALSAADGLVLVDSGAPESTDRLMGSLRRLSAGRVATVFNTHWHLENTGGNEVLGKAAQRSSHTSTRSSGWRRPRGCRLKIAIGRPVLGRPFPARRSASMGR